jgi:WD repeat-containing protein 35
MCGVGEQMEQKDLAVELRTRLGDWFRVVQLVQSGAGDDKLLTTAWNNIGDYYADRQKWHATLTPCFRPCAFMLPFLSFPPSSDSWCVLQHTTGRTCRMKAQKYYAKAKNLRELVTCSYVLDDYSALDKLVDQFADGAEMLRSVGEKFQSVGLCEEAVRAYVKGGDTKMAIDCCVTLNQWDQAVALAEKFSFPQIEGLLTKYASHLLNKQKLFQAVELYRKANKSPEAAKLLCKLGTACVCVCGLLPCRCLMVFLR